jgi:hypothetical protein
MIQRNRPSVVVDTLGWLTVYYTRCYARLSSKAAARRKHSYFLFTTPAALSSLLSEALLANPHIK